MIKVITFILIVPVILKLLMTVFAPVPDDPEEEELKLNYDLIDEISRERERVRNVEDIISTAEAYTAGEHEKSVTISVPDATGIKEVNAFISPEFLQYIYSEREKARTSLKKKCRKMQ